MRFAVRVATPLAGLAARMRAAAEAGRRTNLDEDAVTIALPSTSRLRDPATIAGMSRFEEHDDFGE